MEDEFEKLQNRMEERASIYKDTKLHPFYLFAIGELDWNEMIDEMVDVISINSLK